MQTVKPVLLRPECIPIIELISVIVEYAEFVGVVSTPATLDSRPIAVCQASDSAVDLLIATSSNMIQRFNLDAGSLFSLCVF